MTSTIERPSIFTMSPPTAVPCPDWCEHLTGHPYDLEENDGAESRYHRVSFAGEEFDQSVDVTSYGIYRDGHENLNQPTAQMWVDGNAAGPDLTAERARALAASLVAAAEWLEAHQ